ncbi:unnamed protein product, partial [Iphiclides podalirius]
MSMGTVSKSISGYTNEHDGDWDAARGTRGVGLSDVVKKWRQVFRRVDARKAQFSFRRTLRFRPYYICTGGSGPYGSNPWVTDIDVLNSLKRLRVQLTYQRIRHGTTEVKSKAVESTNIVMTNAARPLRLRPVGGIDETLSNENESQNKLGIMGMAN